jgi:trimeric autotransporter adhesin
MKKCVLLLVTLTFPIFTHGLFAQGTAFTYQGLVTDNGTNFTGAGQFQFALVTSTNTSVQATATAIMGGSSPHEFVESFNLTSGGSGYVNPPAVAITGGGGSGGSAQATVSDGLVTSISIISPGSGYTSTPTVTIGAPPEDVTYVTYWSNDGTSSAGSEPTNAVSLSVSDGLFTVALGDTTLANMTAIPAAVFTEQSNLQLRIWFNDGVNGFAALSPVQNLTPTPYAITALSANTSSNLSGTVSVGQLSGTVGNSQLAHSSITLTAGTGLSGGGTVALGGATTLSNAGVLSVTGNSDIAATNVGGAVTLGDTATSANTASTIVKRDASGNFAAGTITATSFSGAFNGNGANLTSLNADNLSSGTVPLAQLSGITSNQLAVATWQAATNLNGGKAALASNVVSGIGLTNAYITNGVITNSTFAGNGAGLTNLDATQLSSGVIPLARLPLSVVTEGETGVTLSGAFSGNASGLSNLNASCLASGVVPTNVLSGFQPPNYSTISGGLSNDAAGIGAFIGGGGFDGTTYDGNSTQANASAIGGGLGNSIPSSGVYSFIGGGEFNTASGFQGVVGGGVGNVASGPTSTVVGGLTNVASENDGFVGGGMFNTASGPYASVTGGVLNTASGESAMVLGGYGNSASGYASFAAGYEAQAANFGSFVWADAALEEVFSSTADNQFAVRAGGGVLLEANVKVGTGGGDYRQLALGGGNSTGFLYGSFPRFADGIHLGYNYYADASGHDVIANTSGATSRLTLGYGFISLNIGGVDAAPTTQRLLADSSGVTVNGTFNNSSDRNAKQDFAPVSPSRVLEKLVQLPISEWSYKEDAATRHIGPMGQDFYSIFNLGTDEKHIAPIDEGGVALAAIQGLNQKLEQKETEIIELKARLERLEQLISQQMGGATSNAIPP